MARTIAVSDTLRDDLVARFRADTGRTQRIYNGSASSIGAAAIPVSPPLVLACGRLSPDKNFPFLLRAFAKMARKDARLVILGEGAARPVIEAEIARLGLGERASLPGYRDPTPWYAQASCFAMTSTRETFGLVIVEALAAGLPVVTTASGGPPELVGDLGAIIAQGDETGFAAALDAALTSPGDPGPQRARAADFSIEACADAYEALFCEIARRG
jgi:glycosyltransferase involved in cell wall biosynthesis